jgi:hypothetical protein
MSLLLKGVGAASHAPVPRFPETETSFAREFADLLYIVTLLLLYMLHFPNAA